MKNFKPQAIFLAAILIASMFGCKPSEKNYREAYERTMSARRAAQTEYLDSMTLAKMQRTGRPARIPVRDSDTLEVSSGYAVIAKDVDQPDAKLCHFEIVTGSFRQVFNAKEMVTRLQRAGFEDAIVFNTTDKDKHYLVAVCGTDSAASALESFRKVSANDALGLRKPYPFVFQVMNSYRKP